MIKLSKDKLKSKSIPKSINPTRENDLEESEETQSNQQQSIGLGELEKFSQLVLKHMIDDNIPSTPSNFQIYFDKLLDTKPISFKKRITELMELENVNDEELRANIERDVKKGFAKIKTMLQAIATIYKNINVMKALVKKRLTELGVNTSALTAQNVINAFDDDLNKLSSLMDKHILLLKANYEEVSTTLKSVEDQAVFDSRYGVYNKKFFLKSLETELEGSIKYGYSSSLMLLKVKDNVLGIIPSSKDRSLLLRNIAKLLLKTSRRSDVVAHYGDGIFGMVMKHTNIESAEKAGGRIAELIYATSFFMGEMELDIDVELSIVELKKEKSVAECIALSLDTLPKSGKDTQEYAVGQWS